MVKVGKAWIGCCRACSTVVAPLQAPEATLNCQRERTAALNPLDPDGHNHGT